MSVTDSSKGGRVRAELSVAVQVVLYNDPAEGVRSLLRSVAASAGIAKQSGEAGRVEIIVGDSSPQPLEEMANPEWMHREEDVEHNLDSVRYVFFGQNLGSAGGSNRLAQEATTDTILILNPDTYASPEMMKRLLIALRGDQIGITEARQIPLEHPKEYDLRSGDTSWASGACLLVWRSTFEEVGGFDEEHFFLHCDDVDFSWRVRLTGKRVVHVPSAHVFHDKRVSSSGVPLRSGVEEFHSALGRLMLCRRYKRPDLIEETSEWIRLHGSESQRRALEQYLVREQQERLPEPLRGAKRVAQFVHGEYSHHRF